MKFTKGRSGNPSGRPKGTADKRSSFVLDAVRKALGKEPIDHIIELVESIPSKAERAEHYERLLPYMHPKLSNVEHSGSIDSGESTSEQVDKLVQVLKELKS
jgi:hypothetical protein